jgi:hypothetical protein
MDAPYNKSELLDWLAKVENQSILDRVSKIKEETASIPVFDLDTEWESGYTVEEFKEEMYKRIKAYP